MEEEGVFWSKLNNKWAPVVVMSFVSSQNSANSVEGAQSRQSKVPIDRVSL